MVWTYDPLLSKKLVPLGRSEIFQTLRDYTSGALDYKGTNTSATALTSDPTWVITKYTWDGLNPTDIQRTTGAWDDRDTLFIPPPTEDITGASFALYMNEVSGSLTDAVSGVVLSQYNAANTYGITGFSTYDPGIQMNATAGGFRKVSGSANPSLSFGTGSGNILLAIRVDGSLPAFSEIFCTMMYGVGDPGFDIRAVTGINAANSWIGIYLVSTDSTTVYAQWTGSEAGDAVFSGGFHTWEFQINRATGFITLLVDGISQGAVSIATLAGKTLDNVTSGIGLGCDYRIGIDRNVPITVMFVRVKQTAT